MIAPSKQTTGTLFVAGVSYRTAPVEVREKLAVAHPDRLQVSEQILAKGGLAELVLLWTCNRVEIYGVAPVVNGNVHALFECLAREAPVLASQVYCHEGEEALDHLFKVASGLDSMVLGETQITGQVKQAYEAAHAAKLTGKVLNPVFQKALQTAKEIRTRTSIGQGSSSVAGAAVGHAERILGNSWTGRKILVIGAGQMAACCLRHLEKRGGQSVVVTNRSHARARALADTFRGTAIPFNECAQALADADLVISSTGSPDPVLFQDDVAPLMKQRASRPLVMIDIAVPRDIDPGVGTIPGVHLHDIDALQATVRETMQHREQDVALCGDIIESKIGHLMRRLRRSGPHPRRTAAPAASARTGTTV